MDMDNRIKSYWQIRQTMPHPIDFDKFNFIELSQIKR